MNSWIASLKNKISQASAKKSKNRIMDLVAYKAKIQEIRDSLLSEREQEAEVLTRDFLLSDMYQAEVWELLGVCLKGKNPEEAETCYLRALELEPHRADSYLGLGLTSIALNKFSQAVSYLEQAIELQPDNLDALIKLADLLFSLQRRKEAQTIYAKALNLKPDDAKLLCKQGVCLSDISQFGDSEIVFKKALDLEPRNEYMLYEFGMMYLESKNYTEAKNIFNKLMAINSKNPNGYFGLAGTQLAESLFLEAYETQQLGLKVCDIEMVDAHRQMMHICAHLYGKDEEIAYHLSIVDKLAPEATHLNDAVHYLRDHKFVEAITVLELFKLQNPENTIAEVNKALAFLLLGFYKEGWQAYEARTIDKQMKDSILHTSRLIPLPFWDGAPIPDKTLVVVIEQGVGDTIHFVRYLPLLKARVDKVILICNPNLERLFSSVPDITLASSIEEVINADYQILIMSLPMIFKTELATIPNAVPYLSAESALIKAWNERLKPWANQLKVGLVWAGGAVFKGDYNRSTKLSQFAPIFDVKNVAFFSLQLGPQSEQKIDVPQGAELIDFTEYITDFADTAAFVSQLDLVISVDTSVAHLAGALAVPVWVLLPFFPDHRWFLEREDNPWYPTARLFRQTRSRNWDEVFLKMATTLETVASADGELRCTALLAPSRDLMSEAEHYLAIGRVAYAEDDYENAKLAFERAIVLKPDLVNAWYNLGLANQLLDRAAIARICYKRALVLNPNDAGAYYNLACIAADYKNHQESIEYFDEAWRIDSTNPEVAYKFASLLWETFNIKKGLQVQSVGLEFAPYHRLGWVNYALLLAESGDSTAAQVALQRAFSYPAQEDDSLIAEEAELLFSMGELDCSLEAAKLAAKLNPDNLESQLTQGFVYLKQGKLQEGWRLLESRLKVAREDQKKYTADIWNGMDMPESILLVHGEQGLGDMIQCMRYIPLLKPKFKRIVIHIHKPLVTIAKMVEGAEDLEVSCDEIPKHDVRIPAMSIPLRFNTTLDTIPNKLPYLNITHDYLTKWEALTGDRNTKKRIGFAWTGNQVLASNQRRSIPVDLLPVLMGFNKVEWWSLQKDFQGSLPDSIKLIDKMHLTSNMADTAALIMQLDLVITVDTAVAHLAGALGKPVWILLAYNSDYRWLTNRHDSPWYPTALLFRQDQRYTWQPVIQQVLARLEHWVND
ncbi:tetratricopeptide repeat protein [Methyloradius palustris]|uniref:Uncharacterized protein n=1 Tax=Methyloradius palustris TaxID=2778876 RepID=A0A8D5G0L4_9PROT|nr:tetratricopeptide repeat protein [Methyloradius palustris]BCM25759.1 hypothetical protein ZMTM_20180 [Methyloradius palustris]